MPPPKLYQMQRPSPRAASANACCRPLVNANLSGRIWRKDCRWNWYIQSKIGFG